MTEIQKKIREINHLNKQINFEFIPTIHEALSEINRAHNNLMDRYRELIELHQPTQPPPEPRNSQQDNTDNE